MSNKTSTAIVLFTKRAKKNDKYPAKLRVTHNRVQRYYSIDNDTRQYEFSIEEFNKITAPKPRGEHKLIQLEFSLQEEKAQKHIKRLKEFSFDAFKSLWGIKGTGSNIVQFLEKIYSKLDAEEKEHRWNYRSAKTALQAFFKKKDYIDFREITPAKLERFENWMLENGKVFSTVSVYMAAIRKAFNEAIEAQAIPEDIYPFGRGKYAISEPKNTKRALLTNEIKAIYEYRAEPFSIEDYARDFWVFTYLCNGINMKDICKLRYRDVGKEFFSFVRSKTSNKNKGQKAISVPITEETVRIIEKWGSNDRSPDNFVFPFLTEGLTEKQVQYKVRYRVMKVNEGLETIGGNIGIEKKLTTYSARHSFATMLKRSGVSREFIGESLGHSSYRTTQLYLDSFEDEQKKQNAKYLTQF